MADEIEVTVTIPEPVLEPVEIVEPVVEIRLSY